MISAIRDVFCDSFICRFFFCPPAGIGGTAYLMEPAPLWEHQEISWQLSRLIGNIQVGHTITVNSKLNIKPKVNSA